MTNPYQSPESEGGPPSGKGVVAAVFFGLWLVVSLALWVFLRDRFSLPIAGIFGAAIVGFLYATLSIWFRHNG